MTDGELIEPKWPKSGDGGQARVYAQVLGLNGDQVVVCDGEDLAPVKRFGHMGVAISGGFIWPGWS